ncbi:MAG: ASCH domain-containing protein [Candidatus Parvarchaeota archaeon]|nr:ASCH domain-containing protein [Candidatus Parvarchaeota archaeon]
MKCLSVKQPFADLIIAGKKRIEIRGWKTNYRGNLLIHASKIPDITALKRFEIDKSGIALGKIIGKVDLVGCKKYENRRDFLSDKSLHLAGSYKSSYRYGFILENPARLKRPIPLNGRLGIFNIEVKLKSLLP